MSMYFTEEAERAIALTMAIALVIVMWVAMS